MNSRPALAGSSGPPCWPAGRQSRHEPQAGHLGDGCDWFFTVDAKTDLRIYDRVQLVVDDNDTPDDYTDDRVIDALYCHDCDDVDD